MDWKTLFDNWIRANWLYSVSAWVQVFSMLKGSTIIAANIKKGVWSVSWMITEPQQFPPIPSTLLEGCSYTVVSTAILHSCSRAYRQRCQPNWEVIHGITTSSNRLQVQNWSVRSRQTVPPTAKGSNGCLLGPTGLATQIHKKKKKNL